MMLYYFFNDPQATGIVASGRDHFIIPVAKFTKSVFLLRLNQVPPYLCHRNPARVAQVPGVLIPIKRLTDRLR